MAGSCKRVHSIRDQDRLCTEKLAIPKEIDAGRLGSPVRPASRQLIEEAEREGCPACPMMLELSNLLRMMMSQNLHRGNQDAEGLVELEETMQSSPDNMRRSESGYESALVQGEVKINAD